MTAGEVIEVRVTDDTDAVEHLNTAQFAVSGAASLKYFEVPDHCAGPSTCHQWVMRGCGLTSPGAALDAHTFVHRMVSLDFGRIDSPLKFLPTNTRNSANPVLEDLNDIPHILRLIDSTWLDQRSLNRQTSDCFVQSLLQLVGQPVAKGPRMIDVLITGMEASHWVGQQFAADLSRAFPSLNVAALSANFVLGLLQGGVTQVEPLNHPFSTETFKLAPGAVCLVLSHSGTTYPSVWAARLLVAHPDVEVFVMSGHFDTVLSSCVGHDSSHDKFCRRAFSTMTAIRVTEPASITAVAMHHTLTQLLVACMDGLSRQSQIGIRERVLLPQDVVDMRRLTASIAGAAEQICGITAWREQIPTQTHLKIVQLGRRWGSHLTEGFYATALGVAFVLGTVISGWLPISETVKLANIQQHTTLYHFAFYKLGDALVYIFLGIMIMMIHRFVTGRRIFARFGPKTVVIIDACTMNYKLLRAYITKMRSLAFRWTTFNVLGQNGLDHFVHEMTHLTASDVLIAAGRPDGRLASLASYEAAMLMSLKQAKYINSPMNAIEAFSMGHNPWQDSQLFHDNQVHLKSDLRPHFMSERLLGVQGSSASVNPEANIQRLSSLQTSNSNDVLVRQGSSATCADDQEHVPASGIDYTTQQVDEDGLWRIEEALRTASLDKPMLRMFIGMSLASAFRAWRQSMHSSGKNGRRAIGDVWAQRCKNDQQALQAQRLLESYYETRIGATERLIGFQVFFYHMVRKIARLPFLSFDMDRSESRLRVASTPAPIAMRGALPTGVTP